MSGPLRKTLSVIDRNFSPGAENNEILSIELLPGGFSYAILDAIKFKYVLLEDFRLEDAARSRLDYECLKVFFTRLPLLNREYQKIHISYFSPHLVLLPGNISGFEDQKTLLKYSCRVQEDHSVRSDRLNNLDGFGVYSTPNWLLHLLESFFPFHRLRHSGGVCIESMLSTIKIENSFPDIILHVRPLSFDVLLFQKQKPLFYQIFPYHHFDDLLYLLFNVCEQFKMSARAMKLMLAGEISMDSEQYEILSRYFRHVFFANRNDVYRYSSVFDSIPHHFYHTLLNINACG